MKKLSASIFLMLLWFQVSAQCPPAGNITLSSQADVNNFQTLYGSCVNLIVNGNLRIIGNDVASLLPLTNLKGVTGNLEIHNSPELISLAGLENLEYTGNGLWILSNSKLTSLAALTKLTSITENLWIAGNPVLSNLSGLNNLTNLGGIYFEYNNKLTDLTALSKVTSLRGNLHVENCADLMNLQGLHNITTIIGELSFSVNDKLFNLNGLNGLANVGSIDLNSTKLVNILALSLITSVTGDLMINQCDELVSLQGLHNIASVGGSVNILSNINLTNLNGLAKLETVGAFFAIQSNDNLVDLSGLSALKTVALYFTTRFNNKVSAGTFPEFTGGGGLGITFSDNALMTSLPAFPKLVDFDGDIYIDECPALTNLNGLSALENLDGSLYITNNASLINLNGFLNLEQIGEDLIIDNNASLADISGLSLLTSVVRFMYISNNPELVTPGTFAELTDVGNTMYIDGNAKMTSLPTFPKMVNLSGTIQIMNNAVLNSLAGFPALKTIGLGIRISDNSLLNSLSGLEGLKQVNQYFQISGNSSLSNISAIKGIAISENLEISSNPLLGTCAIASVCSLLSISPDQLSIAANATGCNNIEEIQQACEAALPVTLVSFSGKLTAEGSTALAWTTSFETNSDHFMIEHQSPVNEQWSAVGKIPAKKESNALVTYDFLHNQPAIGENLYRLKMVDADQTFAYSRIISIRSNDFADLYAYPNPVTNKLHFSGSGVTQISVFDAGGTLRFKRNLTDKNEVDLKNLLPGKYLIKVQTSDGNSHSRNIIKE